MAKVGFQRTRGQEELEEAWLEAVGREMGKMTRPTGVSGGKLQVQVDHNVIAQELRFREKDLLETLRRALPEEQLTGIRYRVLGR
jgi:predicted nucleic acid-binding Zn ribbon protein